MDKLPTTPHRRSNSVTSNSSVTRGFDPVEQGSLPLFNEVLNPQVLAEFSDGMATLDMNMQRLSRIHESLASFNETFAGLLHGMKMSAWCMDFPEAPTSESFKRDRSEIDTEISEPKSASIPIKTNLNAAPEFDTTYMTNDEASFVSKPTPRKPQKLPRVATLVGSGSKTNSTRKTTATTSSTRRANTAPSRIPAPVQSTSRIPTSRASSRTTRSTRSAVNKTVGPKVNSWR